MTRQIKIDPITRIEGHAKISIHLDEQGFVDNAYFHVTQFRGFEKFAEGRPFYEMPSLMARTCGICPVAHLIAGAKACDDLFAVQIPRTARNLRRVMNLAQIMQSHALSFFYLSSPDLLLGMDADPETRNIFGVLKEFPQLGKEGIRLRQIGQQIIESLGSKRIHPSWVVPGGVNAPLTEEHRDEILSHLPEAKQIAVKTLEFFKSRIDQFQPEIKTFGNFPSLFMGLIDSEGNLEHYNGLLRIVDSAGNIIVDNYDTLKYFDLIDEAAEPWTYMKFPYYKDMGYPQGMYRVGPLARLNIIDDCGTEVADKELKEFREISKGPVLSSFYYHWARLIEIIFSAERMEQLLLDSDILSKHVRAHAEPNSFDGIGVTEAPRGTLIHHYRIDENGLIKWVNLIIATGHNNLTMNRAITQVAKNFVHSDNLQEGMLNRVEAIIRAFDPCLSCSTHAVGQMAMRVQLFSPDGELLDELKRG
ncbi:MAG: Ni/Fe hydrogenase subunit alpha [candidate division Zixibacteria bacterium]|nr:Ni/Fe hydrogenase subunit alpha [candidate division Zixibacteria bacterium]